MHSTFQKKNNFFAESVCFCREMFGLSHFGLVLRICIVNAITFIKNTLVNLFRISFNKLSKIKKKYAYFRYVDKIMFFFSLSLIKNILWSQIWECAFDHIKNMRKRTFLDFGLQIFFWIFEETLTFWKVPRFTVIWFDSLVLGFTLFILFIW